MNHCHSDLLLLLHADKHIMHPIPEAPMPRSLVVGGVRNAYDWALAMKGTCYCCERLSMGRGLEGFLTQPFVSTGFGYSA